MFYRGEEILSNSSNTTTTTIPSINTNNQIIDDKSLILNDFTTSSQQQQNLITNSLKQESQKNISNSLNNQYNNSSSSTTSTQSKSSKYSIQNHQEQTQSIKRKSTEPHQPSSYNPKNSYHHKPVYSEILSSKCILYIYYKGDLSSIIDDHFKKSMTTSASKSSATLSPLSLSSTSPSIKVAKTSKNSSPSCAKHEYTETKDWNKTHSTNSNYDSWLYYNNFSSQFNNTSPYQNGQDNCWNREMASFYSNQHYSSYPFSKGTNTCSNQFTNNQYLSDLDTTYLTTDNRQTKTCLKTSIKDEPQLNISNGSFLQAAVAAVINPYTFQNQSEQINQQNDFNQYGLSANGLTSSSSSLSSLSSSVLTQNLSTTPNDGFHDKVAAAAAAAANQYLTAAAAAANGNSPTSYCHSKYNQYFDLSKGAAPIDCRRSSSSLNSSYQNYGYDFNSSSIDSNLASSSTTTSYKESPTSTTNTQNYASPIWY